MKKKLLALLLAVALLAAFFVLPAQALSAKDFSDVPEDKWYYEDVDFVLRHELFIGKPDNLFAPNDILTREELVMILARLDKADLSDNNVAPYDDVEAGRWSAAAVNWVKGTNITMGTGDNNFNPTGELTREELATFVARFVDYYIAANHYKVVPKRVVEEFPDLNTASDWAIESIEKDRLNGLIYGYVDGLFHPKDLTDRAQIAAIIHRLAVELEIIPEDGPGGNGGNGGGTGGGGGNGGGTTYTLTYMDDDNKTVLGFQTQENNKVFTIITDPIRDGYTFNGWFAEGDTTAYKFGMSYTIPEGKTDDTLTAHWTANPGHTTYKLTYMDDDHTTVLDSKTQDDNNVFAIIADPTRADYTFDGWFAEGDSTAYKFGMNYTIPEGKKEDILTARWTAVPPKPIQVTFNFNYEGMTDVVIDDWKNGESEIIEGGERTGYVFLNWATEQAGGGDKYFPGDKPEFTADTVLYAQWLADEDYIGKAVKETIDLLNEKVISRTEGDGELARGHINIDGDTIFYNNEIDPEDTRLQALSGAIELSEDLLPDLVRFAAQTAVTVLESADGIKNEAKKQADAIVKEIAAEIKNLTGIQIPDYKLSEIVNDVQKFISDTRKAGESQLSSARKDLAEIWKKDGKYIASKCTIVVKDMNGSQVGSPIVAVTESDAHFESGRRAAAKAFAKALATALVQNLKTYSDYETVVDLYATVEFTFEDSTALHESEQKYPHVYPVDLQLTLDGGGLIEFKYQSGGYLLINITEDTQDAYSEEIENVVKAALSNKRVMGTLNTELQKAVNQVLAYSAFAEVQKLFDSLENAVSVNDRMIQWSKDNHFYDIVPAQNGEVSDFINSPLFKRFWGGEIEQYSYAGFDLEGLYYNDTAILNILDDLAQVIADRTESGIRGKIKTLPPSLQESTYQSIMSNMTAQAYRETDLDEYVGEGYGATFERLDKDYKPLMDYILDKASDDCHEKVGQGQQQITKEVIEAACKEVEDLIEEKMPGKSYLQRLTGLKDLKNFANISFGELADLLKNGKVREQLGDKGFSAIQAIQKLVGRIPDSASVVLVNGANRVTFSKDALSAFRTAGSSSAALNALANLLSQPGLKDLTLGDFEIGSEKLIEVSFSGETHSFHLGVHFE